MKRESSFKTKIMSIKEKTFRDRRSSTKVDVEKPFPEESPIQRKKSRDYTKEVVEELVQQKLKAEQTTNQSFIPGSPSSVGQSKRAADKRSSAGE